MLVRIVNTLLIGLTLLAQPLYAEYAQVGNGEKGFKGLNTEIESSKQPDGSHTRFENVYIDGGNIQPVKGRDRLFDTALTDTTINGIFYYEKTSSLNITALLHCNGTNGSTILDANTAHTWTASGNAQIHTGVAKFGSASCLFDGSGDRIGASDSTDWYPGTGEFTLDFWIRFGGGATGSNNGLFGQWADASNWWGLMWNSSSNLRFEAEVAGVTTVAMDFAWAPTEAVWYHVEFTRSGNSWRAFVDGTQIGSTETDADEFPNIASTMEIGRSGVVSGGATLVEFNGRMDEIRWDKDTAYHTANFTAPTSEYDPIDNTPAQKIIVADSDELAAFDLDGSNRTVILSGISNKQWNFLQVGEGLYAINTVDGNYKWYGDTSVLAVRNSNAPNFPYIEEYKGYLFAAENRDLRYSNAIGTAVTDAETWDAANHILVGSNQHTVTGLAKARNSLLIFTAASIQELTGFGGTFKLQNLTNGIGTVNDNTIESDTSGNLIFFAGTQGAFKIKGGTQLEDTASSVEVPNKNAQITKISTPLDDIFLGTNSDIDLDPADYSSSHAYYDLEKDLYFLYIDQHAFIYDNVNNTWSYLPATDIDASTFVFSTVDPTDNKGYVVDNSGYMYKNWHSYANGVESGSVTGAITASGNTTLTCGACSFYTTGNGLKGAWVYVDNESNDIGEWRQISSNTSTQLTVSSAWTTNPVTTDNFYVGYIIPQWKTKQYEFISPPLRQRIDNVWIINNNAPSSQTLEIYAYNNKETYAINATTANLNSSVDLQSKVQNKLNFPSGGNGIIGNWFELGFRSFVYNTSDTVDPPVDILSYTFQYKAEDAR